VLKAKNISEFPKTPQSSSTNHINYQKALITQPTGPNWLKGGTYIEANCLWDFFPHLPSNYTVKEKMLTRFSFCTEKATHILNILTFC
jgi:hypothetical protein